MIAAGFGFRSAASLVSLNDALARAGGDTRAPQQLATASDKADKDVFLAFAKHMALPVRAVGPEALTQPHTLTQSAPSLTARGTGSVAEAAALAAAGPGARLLGPRVVSGDGMATCALAEGGGT